jgi:dUTP pyrophosphatase
MGFCVKLLNQYASLPRRANTLDAGYDISSCEDASIPPLSRKLISTGIIISIPKNTYARVAPRSGLAVKNGIDVFAGVVDAGYRGEVKVLLFNSSNETFNIKIGDRIAQIILEQIITPEVVQVETLEDLNTSSDSRGDGGFGSSGI